MRRLPTVTSLFIVLFLLATSSFANSPSKVTVQKNYGSIPLSFEMNEGQADDRVNFLSHGQGYSMFLTPTEAVMVLSKTAGESKLDSMQLEKNTEPEKVETSTIRMKLVGSNQSPVISGEDKLVTKSNYLIGDDKSKWKTGITNYKKVKYEEVYPGIDLVYYGNQRKLEYDFVVKPGVDYKTIQMTFDGIKSLNIDDSGNLVLKVGEGEVVQKAPFIYQEVEGQRKSVEGKYVQVGLDRVAFHVEDYNHKKELVIDPVLIYSTYLGGTSFDLTWGVAADSSGNAYIVSEAFTNDFPVENPFKSHAGRTDVILSKLNSNGSKLIYSTYIGGSSYDNLTHGNAIHVDGSGSVYLAGQTSSVDFPVVNAFQPIISPVIQPSSTSSPNDAFVLKVSPDGSELVFSTFLGGKHVDRARGITVGPNGNIYVVGDTFSTNFPLKNPLISSGAVKDLGREGVVESGFISKFSADGTKLEYSTFLGGNGSESITGVVVDELDNAYVTGWTRVMVISGV
jgi:hypothetical protein